MYADDTKIWRQVINCDDHLTLQADIKYPLDQALQNKMRFYPSKCKVFMASRFNPPLLHVDVITFTQFYYTMDNNILDYVRSEKDLGITMDRTE